MKLTQEKKEGEKYYGEAVSTAPSGKKIEKKVIAARQPVKSPR